MGDTTFQDLPFVGETDPHDGRYDPHGTLASFLNLLRNEYIADRNDHVSLHPLCENLYLYGTEKPGEPHVYPKIQGMIDTFYALATSNDPVASVKLMTTLDGGEEVITSAGEQVTFDGSKLAEWVQRQLDYRLETARAVPYFQSVVKNSMVYGWQANLQEWDTLLDRPRFRIIPALQWYLQPTEEELANMAAIGVDWPIDAQDAARMYPQVAEKIKATAQRSIYTQPGASGYSGLYYGMPLARPLVTLSIWWIRNRPARMTEQEAIAQGHVEAQTKPLGQPSAPDMPAPTQEVLIHRGTGEEITTEHPNWPQKLVTSQTIQLQNEVVFDGELTEWDIPVTVNYNVRIPNQPFGQSECVRVREQQKDLNQLNAAEMDHATWFKGPTVIADNRLQEKLPEGAVRNLGMKPNKTYWFDSQGGQLKAADMIEVIKAPEMPPVLLEVKRDQLASFNDAGNNPAIQQGQAPTSNSSGILAQTLMQASTATASTKFKYLEEFWWRTCMLTLHNIRENSTPEQMYAIDRTYTPDVIQNVIIPLWKSVQLSVTVSIAGGQSKAAKEMAIREDRQAGLIDDETACDALGYDYKQIQQRRMGAAVAPGAAGSMPGQIPEGTSPNGGSFAPAPAGNASSQVPAPAESAVM